MKKLIITAFAVPLVPAWWLAGWFQDDRTTSNAPGSIARRPFFRLLCAIGLALLGYITCVNLLGRLTGNSITAVWICLLLNAIAGALLLWRRPSDEFRPVRLLSTWRTWIGPVLIACVLGLPQWVVAVSTPYWDEVASSAIHLTALNQFAEGIFPPRHNALPDIGIKYHYAFTILSGTVKWLLGISANVAIDLVSTGLWLFIILFVYFWFRQIKLDRLAAAWGAFTVLLGGGLAWLYLPPIETYNGIAKVPLASELQHRYDPAKSWLDNLIGAAMSPSQHLRNVDGSLSSLPWDIAAQFQQHAVALGIVMTMVAFYLFTIWQKRWIALHHRRLCPCVAPRGVFGDGLAIRRGRLHDGAPGIWVLGGRSEWFPPLEYCRLRPASSVGDLRLGSPPQTTRPQGCRAQYPLHGVDGVRPLLLPRSPNRFLLIRDARRRTVHRDQQILL